MSAAIAAPQANSGRGRFRAWWRRTSATRAYDLAMRLPLMLFATFVVSIQGASLKTYIAAGPGDAGAALFWANAASRTAALLFMFAMAVLTGARLRATVKARGLEPRISALLGTFLYYGFLLFPRRDLSLPEAGASTLLTLLGSALAFVIILRLGKSFSIMAEARRLVTGGIYRFVRHPLYLAEELAVFGIFIQFASPWAALLLLAQIGFQLRRIHNEEGVLSAAFPEYAEYRRRTARLIPAIY